MKSIIFIQKPKPIFNQFKFIKQYDEKFNKLIIITLKNQFSFACIKDT